MFFHKKPPHHVGCLVAHIVATVFLFLATVAALVGVVMSHYISDAGTLVFGTNAASLSLIAFTVSLTFLMKECTACMSECEVCVMPVLPIKSASKKK